MYTRIRVINWIALAAMNACHLHRVPHLILVAPPCRTHLCYLEAVRLAITLLARPFALRVFLFHLVASSLFLFVAPLGIFLLVASHSSFSAALAALILVVLGAHVICDDSIRAVHGEAYPRTQCGN